MKQDKWTQQLHDKLAEHETPAPDGLWNDIEAALGQQSRPAPVVRLRRWAAAAAIAALFVGGGLVLYNNNDVKQSEAVSQITHSQPLPKRGELENERTLPSKPLTAKLVVKQGKTLVAQQEELQTVQQEESVIIQQDEPLIMQQDKQQTGKQDEPQTGTSQQEQPRKSYENIGGGEIRMHRIKRRPSLNLYAMNGLGAKDNSNAVFMADALVRNYTSTFAAENMPAARQQSPIFLSGYEEQQHHRQPVAFGLTVDYPLTSRLSLTSGVVYTRLQSEFTQIMHSQRVGQEQTLHYVGVPLGLNYRLWQQGAFKVYMATGVQADWNVSARLNTEGVDCQIDRDRLQWSANASLGAQYNLLPQLALYAEPGINHYFDNGSRVQNFFKDKPTSLKLQFGIRLDLQR